MKSVNTHFTIGSDKGEVLTTDKALELAAFLENHPKKSITAKFEIKNFEMKISQNSDGILTIAITPTAIKEALLALLGEPEEHITKTIKTK